MGSPKVHMLNLFESIDDSATAEIVGRDLDQYPVTGKDADEILAHLATDVGKHLVLVFQFYTEYGIGQRLHHCGFELNGFFFAQACSWKS